MIDNGRRNEHEAISTPEMTETTPLLESQVPKPAYVTFPESDREIWKPSPGFWWIETGMIVDL